MNEQMQRDLERRKAEAKKNAKRRERYKKLPSYRGEKPANIWVFPLMVVCIIIRDFWKKYVIGTWSEERGKEFLDKNWMKRMDYDEDENVYVFSGNWSEYGWRKTTRNPIERRWVSNYGYWLNRMILNGWTPKDFNREVIKDWDETIIKFKPIKVD